jgi:hypothetical protein
MRFICLSLLVISTLHSHSQAISGRIRDTKNQPVPFATVFIKEISAGTSSNKDGSFVINLPEGTYECIFRCIGYETQSIRLSTGTKPIGVVLVEKTYDLHAVTISSGNEDPAYRIMRKVISMAPIYATVVKSFTREEYIRGNLNIKKISALVKLMARDDLNRLKFKENETYLEESVNTVQYTYLRSIDRLVRSFHSTFPKEMQRETSTIFGSSAINIYLPSAFGSNYHPLAPGAFNYYRFKLEGSTSNGEFLVHKIKIIPKGSGSQYIEGTFYIIEGLWCLYSIEFSLKAAGVTSDQKIDFGEVRKDLWLPITLHTKLNADILGNEAEFAYHLSGTYSKLDLNPAIENIRTFIPSIRTDTANKVQSAKVNFRQIIREEDLLASLQHEEKLSTHDAYKLAQLLNKKFERDQKDSLVKKGEVLIPYTTKVDSNARKFDSSYWNKTRPIPLETVELNSVRKYDSLLLVEKYKAGDSTRSHKNGKSDFLTIILGGTKHTDTTVFLKSKGIFNLMGLDYTIVDGLRYKTDLSWKTVFKNRQCITFYPEVGYAFKREAFLWGLRTVFLISPKTDQTISLSFGQKSVDFNTNGGANFIENQVSTLVFRQNLSRLYQKDYLFLVHSAEIAKGLMFHTMIGLERNSPLVNKGDFSFFYRNSRDFLPNIPDNPLYTMQSHRDCSFTFELRYRPMPYYYVVKGRKVPVDLYQPIFWLHYSKGLHACGGQTDFDLVKGGAEQTLKVGPGNSIRVKIEAGGFLTSRQLNFNRFLHFSAQPLVFGIKEIYGTFQLLDYYEYSNNKFYASGHLDYGSKYLILKRLPVIRNRNWSEHMHVNYLFTPLLKNYTELGYSIGNNLFHFGVFSSFESVTCKETSLKIALKLFSIPE